MSRCMKEIKVMDKEKIAKERKVIPDPIDDRKFQEWKETQKKRTRLLTAYYWGIIR